jgi:small subunit ribosomal protein S6
LKVLIKVTMNRYETVIILTPILSADDVKKVVEGYKDFLKTHGGEVVAEEHWGLKPLAYSIAKKTTGIYQVIEYTGPGDLNHKLDVQFGRDENIMRHMTIRLDKYAIDYNERKRRGEIGRKTQEKKETITTEG